MFNALPKTPQDFFNLSQAYIAAVPKNEQEVKQFADKVKNVITAETAKASNVLKTYQKAATGDASANDIAVANKQAEALMVSARFVAFLAIPGAVFALPLLGKLAEEFDVELVPESVHKEFGI
jgi:hypothetical protein